MITVYFDGKCGLCTREINYFKRRQAQKSIIWQDIARHPEDLQGRGITQTEALMMMHVEDDAGHLHKGVDAFIVMWGQFRGWNLLAKFVSLPGIRPAAGALYRVFAKRRFARHAHCRIAAETDDMAGRDLLAEAHEKGGR
ncbi:DUF393 domain-containing protein [Roseibium sp. RKSG952]|uniref:thiol-disulfide oxidoreductase DCC family protein n=1 Tax=Roseibium sp. RKSG952 TaxID=2529384 RepID=UPI0013CCBEE2|nr:DUF393 domain-containing protein [Roseibium sp. RKSG952]